MIDVIIGLDNGIGLLSTRPIIYTNDLQPLWPCRIKQYSIEILTNFNCFLNKKQKKSLEIICEFTAILVQLPASVNRYGLHLKSYC